MNSTNHALHVYFLQRNQHAFTKLLEPLKAASLLQEAPSSSLSRSLPRNSVLSTASGVHVDVNARDEFGRTALHLTCASVDPAALEYTRLLLAIPGIDVNAQDKESGWTPLHRAFYVANIPACVMLLQRDDTDSATKDYEGNSPFDLYNSTVHGTAPQVPLPTDSSILSLLTWGNNRNATLGHGDGNDRTFPDQVILSSSRGKVQSLRERFSPLGICNVSMSKLHTVVLTKEAGQNLWICGFGSGGRLGTSVHMQYEFAPLAAFIPRVVDVALGQDHTVALTEQGEVFTWGLNRFSQLGYVLENSKGESIQFTPRKVQGNLKKEQMSGIAACKTASCCWNGDTLYTWGTNNGQLGYDKLAAPVQIFPRRVTTIVEAVLHVALSDTAMACLLMSGEIVLHFKGNHFKITFPSSIGLFRTRPEISKIVTEDGIFACLSTSGDVYTFSPKDENSKGKEKTPTPIKPQKVWALRKAHGAVRDISLGSDGTLILCTSSGHVYIRSRYSKATSNKAYQFQQVPLISRVIKVCANNTGSFAALSAVHSPKPVLSPDDTFSDDLLGLLPWCCDTADHAIPTTDINIPIDDEDMLVAKAGAITHRALAYLSDRRRTPVKDGLSDSDTITIGNDHFEIEYPILVARCPELSRANHTWSNGKITLSRKKAHCRQRLHLSGCSPYTLLVLVIYIHSDSLLALWDPRIRLSSQTLLAELGVNVDTVKHELQALASMLRMSALLDALNSVGFRVPEPTLQRDMNFLFLDQLHAAHLSDIYLHFKDHVFQAHSSILRSRTRYFHDFFNNRDWYSHRKVEDDVIHFRLEHMEWKAAQVVLENLYTGHITLLTEHIDKLSSHEAVLDFLFDVMEIANELLAEHMLLVCVTNVLELVDFGNFCSVLIEADRLGSLPLKDSLHEYAAVNLESMLEQHLLDELSLHLLKELALGIRKQQARKHPSRFSDSLMRVMGKYKEWIEKQDIPFPIVPTTSPKPPATRILSRPEPCTASVPVSPTSLYGRSTASNVELPTSETHQVSRVSRSAKINLQPDAKATEDLTIFAMDEEHSPSNASRQKQSKNIGVWNKMNSGHLARSSLKSVVAENSLHDSRTRDSVEGHNAPGPSTLNFSKGKQSKGTNPVVNTRPASSSFGPTFSPVKIPHQRWENRKVSGSPWSQENSPSRGIHQSDENVLSFIAIQQQQRDQNISVPRQKTSLREILEQEEADRREQEFLRWWSEEEARIRNQMNTAEPRYQRGSGKARQTRREVRQVQNEGTSLIGTR